MRCSSTSTSTISNITDTAHTSSDHHRRRTMENWTLIMYWTVSTTNPRFNTPEAERRGGGT